MPRKTSVTAENLAALGAERLAALVMAFAEEDRALRKRLVLALAERGGAAGLTKAVDRRLSALASSYGYVPWEKENTYAAELDGLRGVIAGSLAPIDAAAAAERLERLIGLAPGVLQRVDDSGGRFDDIFRLAVADLGKVWAMLDHRDPEALAAAALALVQNDPYGYCDDLIAESAPALGALGLAALARRATAALADLGEAPDAADDAAARQALLRVLSDVADARGDVDGYIAVQSQTTGGPIDTLGIASRLVEAGRAAEALDWLDRPDGPGPLRVSAWAREMLRIAALDQLGRRAEAQAVRWRLFEQSLDRDLLRAYLRALPDFEDDAALGRAFDLAVRHPDARRALAFLTRWPNLTAAAKLALERLNELDGRDYAILEPAAEALSEAHPLAAAMLLRRMIDSVLDRAASRAYPHAAKNLAACLALDSDVDWSASPWPSHADYLAGLRSRHARKPGFWTAVEGQRSSSRSRR